MIITDWDDAYANGAYITGAKDYPPKWQRQAAAFRTALLHADRAVLDLAYGERPREKYDLFMPEGKARGVVIFVHGGYWLAFDKSHWSHLSEGPLTWGWAVAMPSYTLAPEARVGHITQQIKTAALTIAAQIAGPIRLVGHSAGGHLVTRMNCADLALPRAFLQRLQHTVSISGLHDLRPLLKTQMKQSLKLTQDEAERESAVLQHPNPGASICAWVGGDERPEFIRQSQLLPPVWSGKHNNVSCHIEQGKHHFDVIEDLSLPNSSLTQTLLQDRKTKGMSS